MQKTFIVKIKNALLREHYEISSYYYLRSLINNH